MTDLPPAAPEPIAIDCTQQSLEDLLSTEWVRGNGIGAYASGTLAGCNIRRYHGLLIGATLPPVGRIMALSNVMEELEAGGELYQLATAEFSDTFAPCGAVHVERFIDGPAAAWILKAGPLTLTKELLLGEQVNAVALRYTLTGGAAALRLRPFAALRDFHHLRRANQPNQMVFETIDGGVSLADRMRSIPAVALVSHEAEFRAEGQWWNRFYYRADIARGQDGFEDLYTPGQFHYVLRDGQSCQLTASLGAPVPLGFETTLTGRRRRCEELAQSVGERADETARRLAVASEAFVVQRSFPDAAPSETILAGYPWFADWGRDAFIALPGLLLGTKQYERARAVFRTFAGAVSEGMIPNRFDDYASSAHYNSIDASLWFIIAAERYVAATGDEDFWRSTLQPAAEAILEGYREGTRFDIRADADGLLSGGSRTTQLTWMDAALGDEVVTPRHGKAVEVNAMWYAAHCILAERCFRLDVARAQHYRELAEQIAPAFVHAFWNDSLGWCYDCISNGWPDSSLRPNQLLAVSLPYSPLSDEQQKAIVQIAIARLLTPMGLRTLSPDDPRYRRRYGGSWESRDRAYHQGTVWPWLMGPFIEAYLRVEGAKPFALGQARQWLGGFGEHLRTAGLGQISEICDGDPPHTPRGCIAQAWSVGEVLRAKLLIDELEAHA